MKALAIIPARYASSRLPGKPLVEIAGKAMIQRVYERVREAGSIDRVVVATDDERIHSYVVGFGGESVMTSKNHLSGTDRIAEALDIVEKDTSDSHQIILNVQGDEPMMDPAMLDALINALETRACECATPVARITTTHQLFDENTVKAVLRHDFAALYFSRSPIPFMRDEDANDWIGLHRYYRHIGVYAYHTHALRTFVAASPSQPERAEQLEQLRMLDLGMNLLCVETEYAGQAVDTAEDVMRVEALIG